MPPLKIPSLAMRSSWAPKSVRQLMAATCSVVLFVTTAITPVSAWHGHHRHHGRSQTKRQDATKHKLFGVRQSLIEGFIIENDKGELVQSSNADVLFNPASTLKLATSYVALCHFGANATFPAEAYINSAVDDQGELQGNLYISSNNPILSTSQAELLVKALNEKGIRSVKGDLYVSPDFQLNIGYNGDEAARQLRSIFEGRPRHSRHRRVVYPSSHLKIAGRTKVGEKPVGSSLVAACDSPKLYEILKAMLCYSHNGLAENFGTMLGGPKAVSDFVVDDLGLDKDEIKFSSSSGLGVNRITPKAMIKIVEALREELKESKLTLASILPVAGVDPGTLQHRFKAAAVRGSVVAKTGTLVDTDSGVSALAGEMKTQRDGVLTFVIFEQHGNVNRFRRRQEELVGQIQRDHGGPDRFDYDLKALACRLHH